MNAFLIHFAFELRTGIRNRVLLFLTYLFPLVVYVMLGSFMTSVNPTFRETLIPAMLLFAVMSGTLLSLPDILVSARKAGILRSYRINGVPSLSVLIIALLTTLVHLVILTAIITATAPLAFGAPLPIHWLSYVGVFAVTVFAFASLALLIGVVSSATQATVMWAQLIFLPSMILGGVMVPTSMLPGLMAKLSLLLPTTHAMNAFRGLAMGLTPAFSPLWSVLALLAGGVLAFGLAIYLFRWDSTDTSKSKRLPLALLALAPYVLAVLLLG
jgi:ABC-2 type transport system permease protein